MRPSPWDIIAPAYWTRPQSKALNGWRERRQERRRLATQRPYGALAHGTWLISRSVLIMLALLAFLAIVIWDFNHPISLDRAAAAIGIGPRVRAYAASAFDVLIAGLVLCMGASMYWKLFQSFSPNQGMHLPESRTARLLRLRAIRHLFSTPDTHRLQIIRDLQARRAGWAARVASPGPDRAYLSRLPQLHRWFWFLPTAAFTYMALEKVAVLGGFEFEHTWTWTIGLGFTVYWISLYAGLPLARRRLRRTLSAETCPNCTYDLSTCPPAIDPSNLRGLRIGPRRCPECASLWPLIPPPLSPTGTPIEVTGPPFEPHEAPALEPTTSLRIA